MNILKIAGRIIAFAVGVALFLSILFFWVQEISVFNWVKYLCRRFQTPINTSNYIFSEGLSEKIEDGHFGYIDQTGKMVIAPQFDFAYPFQKNGMALVIVDLKYGLINTSGDFLLPPEGEALGLQVGDRIVSEDGEPIFTLQQISNALKLHLSSDRPIVVLRNGESLSFSIPANQEKIGTGLIYSFF